MRCRKCMAGLPSPAAFCLACGTRNAIGCGLFCDGSNIYLFFIAESGCETHTFKVYNDEFEISKRNTFELVAERMHERRMDEVVISAINERILLETAEWVKRTSIHDVSVITTDIFQSANEFFNAISKYFRTKKALKRVDIRPDKKIRGAHTTVIGGKYGLKLLHRLAVCEYVKKIVPGVIEAKGTAAGGGVRLKLSRSDENGNIRAMLIDGASVQKILVITTASSAEEGIEVKKILESYL